MLVQPSQPVINLSNAVGDSGYPQPGDSVSGLSNTPAIIA
jgi:hypothetical protein